MPRSSGVRSARLRSAFGERFIDGRLMVETQRLRLRTWRDEDLDLLLEMQGDPQTMRYMADGHCPDRGECAEAIEQIESHRCEHGFGIWAAEMRATGELVGWVGLTTPGWLPEVMPAVEVGYLFGRAHWGQGLATEAAHRSLRFGFEELGFTSIIGIHQKANTASGVVMEKLGMRKVMETRHPGIGRVLEVKTIDRKTFEEAG